MIVIRIVTIIKVFSYILCLIIAVSPELSSQIKSKSIISGRINDAETGDPIPNVNLFLAYTTIGSTTGKDGKYIIKNIPLGQYDLIISHIGYELKAINIRFLTPESVIRNYVLNPIIIKGDKIKVEATIPEEWKKNLKIFTELFIGKTKNSKDCKILNPEVINFKVDPNTEIFTAFTDSLIYLSNQALGYKINTILYLFIWNPKSGRIKYQVYPKFEAIELHSEKEIWKIVIEII